LIKSKYKLLGVFWDGLNVSDTIQLMDDNVYISDVNEYPNLFDNCGIRKVAISNILEIENLDEIDKLFDKMRKYSSILISIDYIPVDNKIVKNFYKKRIKQIYSYFCCSLPNTKFYLSSNYKNI
jgi:hypothetical protein